MLSKFVSRARYSQCKLYVLSNSLELRDSCQTIINEAKEAGTYKVERVI